MLQNVSLFPMFSKYPFLVVLSTKEEKSMKVRYELEKDTKAFENRKNFYKKVSLTPEHVVSAKLIHKNRVEVVDKSSAGIFIDATDGLITHQKNLFLAITVADCLPIFLYDPAKEVVGLLHAGWRGLEAQIIPLGISTMQKAFGSIPTDIIAGIGPGIDVCHFAVKGDVLNKFAEYKHMVREEGGETFLNLKEIAQQQLIKTGIKKEHVEINPLCTFCEKDIFYSHRRDHTDPLEAMLAVIGMPA